MSVSNFMRRLQQTKGSTEDVHLRVIKVVESLFSNTYIVNDDDVIGEVDSRSKIWPGTIR